MQHKKKLFVGGIQEVMKDLADLALTCKEMSQQISQHAFPALAEKVDKSTWQRYEIASASNDRLPPIWDKVLYDPRACTLPELKVRLTLTSNHLEAFHGNKCSTNVMVMSSESQFCRECTPC